jgi:polysaccharide export outer membrane protein
MLLNNTNLWAASVLSIVFILCINTYSQEIDPKIISNLSEQELKLIKENIDLNNINNGSNELKQISPLKESTKSNNNLDDRNLDLSGQKYGYQFFSTMATSTSAMADLPLPNDYKISLRDQITIILSGAKEEIFDLNVKLDGTILFPELGSIGVVDKTFGEVKNLLTNLVQQSYIGVQVDLSLKNLSAKKVSIVGAVKAPGTYLVNPFSTITSTLAYSGGISRIGTLRNIKLIRNNGDVFEFDLYDLLIRGDRSNDILVEAGDTILIEPSKSFISLEGYVLRPAIYEFKENETISDILEFGLGFANESNESKVSIDVLMKKENIVKQIEISNYSMKLENVVKIEVFKYSTISEKGIRIIGAIDQPGYYVEKNYVSLEELIDNLNFVNVYPWLAVLQQFDDALNLKSTVLFNLEDKNTYSNLELLPNSQIIFFDKDEINLSLLNDTTRELVDDFSLNITHNSKKYKLPVFGKLKALNLVEFLGLDMTDIDSEAIYTSPNINQVVKNDYKKLQFTAGKFHTLNFRAPENDLIEVQISGQVEFPGTYTLNNDASLEDIYILAGKIKSKAFTDGIIFRRDTVKKQQLKAIQDSRNSVNEIMIANAQEGNEILDAEIIKALSYEFDESSLGRIAGDFVPGSTFAKQFVLQDGDVVTVPKNPFTITVVGEVLNPATVIYDPKLSFSSLIDSVGGYKDYADKSKVYIISANGMVRRIHRNIFIKDNRLNNGDTIVVPRNLIINSPISETLLPITQILADLAFSAAAIESLSNAN